MNASQLVNFLNAIGIGDMDGIRAKLDEARGSCEAIGEADLAKKLTEAGEALGKADAKTFRKRIETVVAELGHIAMR